VNKRIEANDAEALITMGNFYRHGQFGLPSDRDKAMELWQKAAELGSAHANFRIGFKYMCSDQSLFGWHWIRKNARHHYEIAAMKGHTEARHELGRFESCPFECNMPRATKHWIIAAKAGYNGSMEEIKKLFLAGNGEVTKEEYAQTLREWYDACAEMKSDQRDEADNWRRQRYGH